ncbi:MAG: hypothetical protein R3C68_02460 [Myxococcota bacterium]
MFRRADGTVERVAAIAWPYCESCHATLRKLDRMQRFMTLTGAAQMLIVIYIVGAPSVVTICGYSPCHPGGIFCALYSASQRRRAP